MRFSFRQETWPFTWVRRHNSLFKAWVPLESPHDCSPSEGGGLSRGSGFGSISSVSPQEVSKLRTGWRHPLFIWLSLQDQPFRSSQLRHYSLGPWALELFPLIVIVKKVINLAIFPLSRGFNACFALCDLLRSHSWRDIFPPWSLMLTSPVVEPRASQKPLVSSLLI